MIGIQTSGYTRLQFCMKLTLHSSVYLKKHVYLEEELCDKVLNFMPLSIL